MNKQGQKSCQNKLKNGFYISLDFELFWGFDIDCILSEQQKEKFDKTKALVPHLLELFKKYNIACTWAIVGALLNETKQELYSNIPSIRPSYANFKSRNFEKMEWIADSSTKTPWCFAKELCQLIKETPRQEIGTHTYSHYYCLEEEQTLETFLTDIEIAREITFSKLKIYPKSIVFPRNQINYIKNLAKYGIQVYRGTQKHWAYNEGNHLKSTSISRRFFRFVDRYLPLTSHVFDIQVVNQEEKMPLVNVQQSRLLVGYNKKVSVLEPIRIGRIKAEMTEAAKNKLSYHLWWHPHNFAEFPERNLKNLDNLLRHYSFLKNNYEFKNYTLIEAIA